MSAQSQARTQSIITGLMIFLVAVVIWLFAEAQGVVEQTVDTRIEFGVSTDRSLQVLDANWSGSVTVRLNGPRTAVDAAVTILSRDLQIPLQTGAGSEDRTIDLRDEIRNHAALADTTVSIQSVEPPTLNVRVESLVTRRNVPIRVELPDVELEGDPEVTPQSVTVVLPQEISDRLGQDSNALTIIARPSPEAILNAREGERVRLNAQLSAPGSLRSVQPLTITPPVATVAVTIRRRLDTHTVPFAPVWVLLPPAEMERWRVRVAPESVGLQDVVITGPSDIIDRIRRQDLPVVAVVQLTDVDLDARITSKAASFPLLPDSCQVVGGARAVSLIIEPRSASPSGQPGGGSH